MSDKCPKCGAKKHSGVSRFTWACGSISGGHSKRCKDRQIAALTARVEELEDAAGRVHAYMGGNEAYEHGWMNYPDKPEETPKKLMDRILAAKEAEHE